MMLVVPRGMVRVGSRHFRCESSTHARDGGGTKVRETTERTTRSPAAVVDQ